MAQEYAKDYYWAEYVIKHKILHDQDTEAILFHPEDSKKYLNWQQGYEDYLNYKLFNESLNNAKS